MDYLRSVLFVLSLMSSAVLSVQGQATELDEAHRIALEKQTEKISKSVNVATLRSTVANSALRKEATKEIANAIHAAWQEETQKSKPNRFKVIKRENGTFLTSKRQLNDYLRAKKIKKTDYPYYQMRHISGTGKKRRFAHEDILHLENSKLAPNNKKENDDSAKVAILFLQQWFSGKNPEHQALDLSFWQEGSAEIHRKWVERNHSWCGEKLKAPFEQLPLEEANKDTQILILAVQTLSQPSVFTAK